MKTDYWYNNLDTLVNSKNILEFWPAKQHTKAEKFNAITRFILYAGALMSVTKDTTYYFVLSVIFVIVMAFFSKKTENFSDRKEKEVKRNIARHVHPKHTKIVEEDCKKPTDENPFSNVLMNEYTDDSNRPPACPIEEVEEDVKDKFMKGLYSDINDVYERENSQRQFYSTPNTQIPNDQINFAKWCYMQDVNCKSDPSKCTGFEAGPGRN